MKAKIYDDYTDIYPTNKEVKELCKPGEKANTCSWLLMASDGWLCSSKNRPLDIIDRREVGDMVAMRDGCDKVNNWSPVGMIDYYEGMEIEF